MRTENHHRLAGCYERDSKGNWVHSRQFSADEYETPPRLHAGGFGLASTMSDYMRFLQMILNGGELEGVRLLSPKTVELMLSDNGQKRADFTPLNTKKANLEVGTKVKKCSFEILRKG